MILGLIGAVACWFISKSILATIGTFYLLTGIRKSSLWLGIPGTSRISVLPPIMWRATLGSFFYGMFLWPLVLIGCGGDPLHQYFEQLKRSGMSYTEINEYLKRQDEDWQVKSKGQIKNTENSKPPPKNKPPKDEDDWMHPWKY
jgi:hypothetical protein